MATYNERPASTSAMKPEQLDPGCYYHGTFERFYGDGNSAGWEDADFARIENDVYMKFPYDERKLYRFRGETLWIYN